MIKCETCRANKVCDHDRFGFETRGGYITEGDYGESDIKIFADKLIKHLEEKIEGCGYPDSNTQPIVFGTMLGLKYALSLVQVLSGTKEMDKKISRGIRRAFLMTNYYGAKLPKTDLRDYKVKAGATNIVNFDLTNLPPIKSQGSVNSCAAHSSSSILEWLNQKETGTYRELSAGFIYGMQGVAFNRLESGMYLRDVCKIIQKYGDCLVETIPYNIEMPECYNRLNGDLNEGVYKEAAICKIESYAKCDTDETVKYALMNYSPVLMSVKWHEKYKVNDDVILFDTTSDNGYHAVMVYGFNEKGWLCQNSWGKSWGNKGRFILPYEHGFIEAWSFVDAKNSDVHKPKRNKMLDIIYKVLNFFANLFKKK